MSDIRGDAAWLVVMGRQIFICDREPLSVVFVCMTNDDSAPTNYITKYMHPKTIPHLHFHMQAEARASNCGAEEESESAAAAKVQGHGENDGDGKNLQDSGGNSEILQLEY